MTNEDPAEIITIDHKPSGPGFFGRLIRALFRLLLTVVVGVVLGGAIYFGARSFYRQAVTIPAEASLLRMDDMTAEQARVATQSAAGIDDLRLRIEKLEKARQDDAEEISSLQAEVLTLNQKVEQVQTAAASLDEIQNNLSAVATQSMKNGMDLNEFLSSANSPVSELRQEIQLLRAMELLNRCRLYLSQNNYGLAAQDANLVRQIFLEMKAEADADAVVLIDTWIARLDMALVNLTVAPVVAGEDLEMVWRMVLVGLPRQAATAAGQDGSPVSATLQSTMTLTPTPGKSPTPVPTLRP
jgi:chaperonin cofactor prefoldin